MLSLSRVGALLTGYSAPLSVFRAAASAAAASAAVAADASPGPSGFVCVGEEWYRFPSSFFVPAGLSLGFVERGFKGADAVLFLLLARRRNWGT